MSWPRLTTDRLVLRRWADADRGAFHAMNSDPAVMATLGHVMSRAESDAFLNRIEEAFEIQGFGLWCVELAGEPIGYTGYMKPWFRDGVEIGTIYPVTQVIAATSGNPFATTAELPFTGAPVAIGQKAKMANAHEAFREHVQEKAPDQLFTAQAHDFMAMPVPIVLVA